MSSQPTQTINSTDPALQHPSLQHLLFVDSVYLLPCNPCRLMREQKEASGNGLTTVPRQNGFQSKNKHFNSRAEHRPVSVRSGSKTGHFINLKILLKRNHGNGVPVSVSAGRRGRPQNESAPNYSHHHCSRGKLHRGRMEVQLCIATQSDNLEHLQSVRIVCVCV